MLSGPAVYSGGGPHWHVGVETGQPARPPNPPSEDLSILCPEWPLLCWLVGTLPSPSTWACPLGTLGVKLPGADEAEPAAWSRAPAEQHTPSRTQAYYFHCETWKVVWAALCQQKPAWDTVLSYYFRDLCKRLSKHGGKFFLLEEYILTEAELTNKDSR